LLMAVAMQAVCYTILKYLEFRQFMAVNHVGFTAINPAWFMDLNGLLKIISSSKRPLRIRTDSRQVGAGDVFVAIKGTEFDGHNFIGQAVAAGARYIVGQRPVDCENAEVILTEDTAKAAAELAQAYYGHPAQRLINLAVTGTNGKTTVAHLVRSVLNRNGCKCGMLGTVSYDTGVEIIQAALTTPDCMTTARIQAQMVDAGCKFMVIEASSHALSQQRLAAIEFSAAAFTNLSGDHLDYHRTEKDYLAAKTGLFERLKADATAVLNKQSGHSKIIAKKTRAKILWYSLDGDADITADLESADIQQTIFKLRYAGASAVVQSPLIGHYNVSNHLAAAGLCLTAGLDLQTIADGLSSLKTIPGRLERIAVSNGALQGASRVFIDYAHTDDALRNVLSTLKPLCAGRLIVVFGCGGDRDRTKRPRMAAAAEQSADIVIVTSDNPRCENPLAIIGGIVTGFKNPTADKILVEADREKAIALSIKLAGKDDIVLIAGKGHETYQIIGDEKLPFSDKQTALRYLSVKV